MELNKTIKIWVFNQLFSKEYPSFHFLNFCGWTVFIILDLFVFYLYEFRNTSYIQNIVEWVPGIIITILLRKRFTRYNYRIKSIREILTYILSHVFIAALIFVLGYNFVSTLFNLHKLNYYSALFFNISYISIKMTKAVPLLFSWSMLYFGIKFWVDYKKEEEKSQKAILLAQNAQLMMLRYQLNPHFLFNSFTSLRALIRLDAVKAEQMLSRLSDFFRYSLINKTDNFIKLSEELNAIKNYVEIEKIRFEENLEFEISIDQNCYNITLPAYIITPLIENAIKYGMKTSEMPLKIYLSVECINEILTIEVKNTGTWYEHTNSEKKKISSTGTGLENIKQRLEHFYRSNYKFITKSENNNVLIRIILSGAGYAKSN